MVIGHCIASLKMCSKQIYQCMQRCTRTTLSMHQHCTFYQSHQHPQGAILFIAANLSCLRPLAVAQLHATMFAIFNDVALRHRGEMTHQQCNCGWSNHTLEMHHFVLLKLFKKCSTQKLKSCLT